MPRTIVVPGFDFTGGFFYPEVLELLVQHLRANVPEITNESEGEVAMQLLSAFALVAHLCNVNLDIVAHESLMVTAQLRDTLVAHLKLIGFIVDGDIPATTDLLLTLSSTLTTTTEVVKTNSLFQTRRLSDQEPIVYEVEDAYEVTRTDQVTACFVYDASGPSYTDRTTEANTNSSTFSVLPATPAAGDALYIGHDTAMTNRLRIAGLTTPMSGIFGVWEYCDNELSDDFPDNVAGTGSQLKIIVDAMLNTDGSIIHTGLEVTVTLNSTGATENAVVAHDGTNNYVLVGYLGQSSPSEDVLDYTVGAQWHRVDGLDDDTNDGSTTLELNGDIDFVLPQTSTRNWTPIEVNGVTAYWLRFRVVSVTSPVEAIIDRIHWDKRDLFVLVSSKQGQTAISETLGSSDGTASQEFGLDNGNVIPGSVVIEVDAQEWSEVVDFTSSTSVDEHYVVEVDSDGVGTVTFGDGINGKIPPSGTNNVIATYRYGAQEDGNVGSETITVNRSGLGTIKRVTNPRPASGWIERRGNTPEDRTRLKFEGPASLRALSRAVTADDVEYLTTAFKSSSGVRPFARANAIEEGFGVKTVKVVTVGPAGAATSSGDRLELEEYFNGNDETGESGVMVANQRVFARDYTAVPIDVTATVTGTITQEEVENALNAFLSPVAVLDDGVTYRWKFDGVVTLSSIIGAIIRLDDVDDVAVTVPASNTSLTNEQLPEPGTLTITVVAP